MAVLSFLSCLTISDLCAFIIAQKSESVKVKEGQQTASVGDYIDLALCFLLFSLIFFDF